tara:strand:- start:3919 stop:5325 length:1407 start_codon:yes stop_codon:yes gene_type:complete
MLIVIPIEGYSREIEKSIALASYLHQKNNIRVVVAEQSLARRIAISFKDQAILIGKQFFTENNKEIVDVKNLDELLENDVNILYIDEEGGLFLRENSSKNELLHLRCRYPFHHIEKSRRKQIKICHWGNMQSDHLNDLNKNFDNYITGPTFVDCAKIFRERKKDRISNDPSISFTQSYNELCNKDFKCDNLFELLDYMSDKYIKSYSKFDSNLMNELILFGAYNFLLNSKKFSVIKWRPHPSARSKLSINHLKKIVHKNGIEAISRPTYHPINSYLCSSDVFLHSGCTTSIQARLLNKQTIYLRSINPRRALHIKDEISISKINNNLIDKIFEISNKEMKISKDTFSDFTCNILHNINKNNLYSFSKISQIIDKFIDEKKLKKHLSDESSELLNSFDKLSSYIYTSKFKKKLRRLVPNTKSNLFAKYGLLKFDKINKNDVDLIISKLSDYLDHKNLSNPYVKDYYVLF